MNNYSFWKLISTHKIVIPVIQRDYAQGRHTKKTEAVRQSFVSSLISALTKEAQPLHLNFVYGKIKGLLDLKKLEENKKAIESMLSAVKGYSQSLELDFKYDLLDNGTGNTGGNRTSLLPLDGQQRLTTLFLLHCYLMKKLNRKDLLEKLHNFTYLTRPSTKQFCQELINQELIISSDINVSNSITDSSWFFRFWLKDPTVKGMLTMLDEIHQQCNELAASDLPGMLDKLISTEQATKAVSFELLDLDDFELTDKLYVKMNSRGKPLSIYENFKAWLMEYIEDQSWTITVDDWQNKLDTTWADLFWDNKDDDENMLIDEEYMRFFRNMMQIFFFLNHELEPSQNDQAKKDLCSENRKTANRLASDVGEDGEYVYISNHEYISFDVLTESNINETFQILDTFSSHKVNKLVNPVFKKFIANPATLPSKIRFYALYHFLAQAGERPELGLITRFLRVYNNLINNRQIDITATKTILAGIRNDSQYFTEIYENLVDDTKLKLSGFRGSQIAEERLKAALLLRNDSWTDLISAAESNVFFGGQIGFLFHQCGIKDHKTVLDKTKWTNEINAEKAELFERYLKVVLTLFDDNGFRDDKNYYFERALLTFGDYLLRSGRYSDGSKKLFPRNNKARDNSWHRILREYEEPSNEQYKNAWGCFTKLINKLLEEDGCSLESICNDFPVDVNDWRTPFITYPETFERCGNNRWFIEWEEQRYLLSKANRRSDYSELQSFYLFKSALEPEISTYLPFKNTYYYSCRQKDGYPGAILEGFNYQNLNIELAVRYYGGNEKPWEIKLYAKDEDISKVSYLLNEQLQNKHDYSLDQIQDNPNRSNYYIHLSKELTTPDIANHIQSLCRQLNDLLTQSPEERSENGEINNG